MNLALDLGITCFDTGQTYGEGRSETWMGKVLKHRRKDIFVAIRDQKVARFIEYAGRAISRHLPNNVELISRMTMKAAHCCPVNASAMARK